MAQGVNTKFSTLHNTLQSKQVMSAPQWLISVTDNYGQSLTGGTYAGYKSYGGLIDYAEEMNIISGQHSGIKGVCFSNVKITLLRSENSKKITDAFIGNALMSRISLVKVQMKRTLKEVARISYDVCKIFQIKSFLEYCEFSFQYGSRAEIYQVLDSVGEAAGVV